MSLRIILFQFSRPLLCGNSHDMSLDKSSDNFESDGDILSGYFKIVFLLINLHEPCGLDGLSRGSVEERNRNDNCQQ